MEYDTMRAVITVLMLLLFLGIVAWAYSSRQRKRFDAAAQLPFEDEHAHEKAQTDAPAAREEHPR